MNTSTFLMAALFCLLFICSCDKKQSAIDHLSDFVEKVEKKAPEYTEDDWEQANKEYEELIAEIGKYEYSGEETKQIAEMKGKFAGIKAKSSVNKFIDGIDKAAKEVKGVIDGFTEGLTGGNDSGKE